MRAGAPADHTRPSTTRKKECATSERSAKHRSRPWRLGRRVLLERRHRTPPGRGLPGAGAPFPLSSLADDVARLRQVLEFQDGPTIVVGHSYGGQIITALGPDAANVVGLVYIAAFGLDEGESLGALLSQGPVTPALAHLFTDSRGFGWLSEDDFVSHFAGDVDPTRARVMYAVQQALASSAFTDIMGAPAWKSLPSWYLVAVNDEAIPPDAERMFASRMGATTIEVPSSHVAMVSHPQEVTDLIKAAVETCAAAPAR
jgi:pimeloyl-ACP methyl ester carboxylesterase